MYSSTLVQGMSSRLFKSLEDYKTGGYTLRPTGIIWVHFEHFGSEHVSSSLLRVPFALNTLLHAHEGCQRLGGGLDESRRCRHSALG